MKSPDEYKENYTHGRTPQPEIKNQQEHDVELLNLIRFTEKSVERFLRKIYPVIHSEELEEENNEVIYPYDKTKDPDRS